MKYIPVKVILLVFLVSCATSKLPLQKMAFAPNPAIAHRGAFKANNYPENSIAALKEAIRLKCTGSEFDVRMTADDSLIINHDPHYHKMEIEKMTYRELAAIPLSNGEMLPTLRQYLTAGLANNMHTRLVVEIKPSGVSKERGKLIAERVLKLVQELRAAPYVAYISFDYDILKKIIELSPGVHTQYLNGDVPPEQLRKDGISGADYHFSVFQKHPEWIESAQENNVVLNAWTVNSREDMQWLLSKKFQYITTNEPEMLLALWNSLPASKH
jgi:glycerophosphoryl diester phosphodiesterase